MSGRLHEKRRLVFESIYERYARADFIESDPIRYPLRYPNAEDREIVGLLAALFAYGRVASIFQFLDRLLDLLGPSPCEVLHDRTFRKPGKKSAATGQSSLYYRFQDSSDITMLLDLLSEVIRETPFPRFDGTSGSDIYEQIDKLIDELNERIPAHRRSAGWTFLIGKPGARSSAKRWCLFFRWMVRAGFPDTGLYTELRPEQLIYPLDTHIVRLSGWTGLTTRRSIGRQTAREITDAFRGIDPADPLRFDFALTRPGILNDQSMLGLLKNLGRP